MVLLLAVNINSHFQIDFCVAGHESARKKINVDLFKRAWKN